MRILQVINSLDTGGAEKLLTDTIPIYRTHGIEMDLLVLDGTDHPLLETLRKKSDCTIYPLGNGSIYHPVHIFRIRKFLIKYDIIHVHLFPSLYWVAFAKMISFSKVKLLFTEHNTSNNRRNKLTFKLLDKFIYAKYNRIITISEEVDRQLKAHLKCGPAKFELIPNGVDLDKIEKAIPFDPLELGVSENEKIVVQVSSFTKQKDQQTLIKALLHMQNSPKLWLVGSGELLDECKALVEDLNLLDNVRFLGVRMDVPRLLKSADVVVLSSHFEGLSLSSIEGLASGKPFVASQVPGLTEVVDGAGILFPNGNAKVLAEKLDELFDTPSHYSATVVRCQERASQYGIDKMIDKHLNVYHELWKNQS